jgi:integrase/recombinase XerC
VQQAEINHIDAFIKSLHHLSEQTRKAYLRDIGNFRGYCDLRNVESWRDVDGRQIRAYVSQRHRQGIGGRSLQRNLSAIRAFYRYLMKIKVVKNNPAQGIVTPKTAKKLPNTLDVDQSAQLVEIKADDLLSVRDKAMFELMYSCGLRLSELVSLNLDSIDLGDAVVTVTGKGNKTRILPVGQHAIQATQSWLKQRAMLYLSVNGVAVSVRAIFSNDYVIGQKNKVLTHMFTRICYAIPLPHMCWNPAVIYVRYRNY